MLARDSRTGRIIPGLQPQATLIAEDGESYGAGEMFFTSYPWLTHYEGSVRIPRKGLYTLRVHFGPPAFGAGAARAIASPPLPMWILKTSR